MQGRKVHISLFCNFEVGEEMCLKSTIFKCLDSEVQVPPPLKVIRKLVYIPPKLQLYFGLVQTNQKNTIPHPFILMRMQKIGIHFGLEKQLGLLLL